MCDVNYQNDGNGNCVESPCGVTTLSAATTNGSPCVVDLRVGVYSYPYNLLYGRNANGVDDSRITNAELVIDQNTSPKIPIQLKYNQFITVYCGKTSNFLLQ